MLLCRLKGGFGGVSGWGFSSDVGVTGAQVSNEKGR